MKRTHHLPHSTKVHCDSCNHCFIEEAHETRTERLMHQSAQAFLKQYNELCAEVAFNIIKRQLDIFQILQVGWWYTVEPKIGYPSC